MTNEYPRLYSVKEVAAILNMSARTILRMITEGRLHAIKVSGVWRIRKDVLDKIIGDAPKL